MDEKTLEYMGGRVDKGRKILGDIEKLNIQLENLVQRNGYTTYINISTINKASFSSTVHENIVEKVHAATIKAVKEEIEHLENLFAEL